MSQASGSVVYAGTSASGVFLTADGGVSWMPINTGLTNLSVTAITRAVGEACADPCTPLPLFAGTSGGGIFRKDAPGWVPANSGLTNLSVSSLIAAGNALYAGTLAGGAFRSTNLGATWTPINSLLSMRVQTLAAIPGSAATLFAGTDRGTFKTTDAGATWTAMTFPPFVHFDGTSFAIDPSSPSTIYASGTGQMCPSPCAAPSISAVYRSTNGGMTWTNIDAGLTNKLVGALAVSPLAPPVVWAGTSGSGVFESTNNGDSWAPINDGLANLFVSVLAVFPSAPAAVYAGTSGGVYRAVSDATCAPSGTSLCLNNARFNVQVTWRVPSQGTSGAGMAVPMTGDTGHFWFFTSNNVELVVKVEDGRAFNGKFWVFYGALSNVEYTITVTDTVTGNVNTYFNPSGQLASVADTSAF